MPGQSADIKKLKALVSDGRLADALDASQQFVAQAGLPALAEWKSTLLTLQSRYNQLQQQVARGTVDEQFNQLTQNKITSDLVDILEKIEKGEGPTVVNTPTAAPNNKLWKWLAVGLAVILISGLSWRLLSKSQQGGGNSRADSNPPSVPANDPVSEEEMVKPCPSFRENGDFKALVLPYEIIGNGEPLNINRLVRSKIADLLNEYDISAEVRVLNLSVDEIDPYPSSSRDADELGVGCGAELVVWGQTSYLSDPEESKTFFRFVDSKNWSFDAMTLNESMQLDVLTSLSDLSLDGDSFTAGIEAAFQLVFGMQAHWAGNEEEAIALLEDSPAVPADGAYYILQQQCLAEAYTALDKEAEAIDAYAKLLSVDSLNTLALQNKGTLLYLSGNYQEAQETLDAGITIDSNLLEARFTRIATNLALERVDLAEKDYQFVKENYGMTDPTHSSGSNTETDKRIGVFQRDIKSSRATQTRRLREVNQKLENNPNNTKVLEEQAVLNRNLGNRSQAVSAAQELVRQDRSNTIGYSILLNHYVDKKDWQKVSRIQAEVKSQDIEIQEIRPMLQPRTKELMNRQLEN